MLARESDRWPVTLTVVLGILLAVRPTFLLAAEGFETWEIDLSRWWGVALVLLVWSWRSLEVRGLEIDGLMRLGVFATPTMGLLGLVAGQRLLLVLAFCATVGALCRGWMIIALQASRAMLPDAER